MCIATLVSDTKQEERKLDEVMEAIGRMGERVAASVQVRGRENQRSVGLASFVCLLKNNIAVGGVRAAVGDPSAYRGIGGGIVEIFMLTANICVLPKSLSLV